MRPAAHFAALAALRVALAAGAAAVYLWLCTRVSMQ